MLASCQNPMHRIEDKIDAFEKLEPRRFASYQGPKHPMRFAWSGAATLRPLLFVHGSPGSWKAWAEFLMDAKLAERFHVLAVDRPGYDGSNRGVAELSLAAQAASIAAVLRENKSGKPAIVIGHSYGGPVIARLAMDFPESVAGLVFVASSVAPELEETKWYQYPATWWPLRWLVPSPLRVCNEEIMALKSELVAMLPRWKEIRAPAVLIQGAEDDLVPKENLDFLRAQLGNVTDATLVPGLNHFVPWRRPDLILSGIDRLAKLAGD